MLSWSSHHSQSNGRVWISKYHQKKIKKWKRLVSFEIPHKIFDISLVDSIAQWYVWQLSLSSMNFVPWWISSLQNEGRKLFSITSMIFSIFLVANEKFHLIMNTEFQLPHLWACRTPKWTLVRNLQIRLSLDEVCSDSIWVNWIQVLVVGNDQLAYPTRLSWSHAWTFRWDKDKPNR